MASQDNSFPLGLGTLGLTIIIPSAEPCIAPLPSFFLWKDDFPCIDQLCYGRKTFLPYSDVSKSDQTSFFFSLSHCKSMQFSMGRQLALCAVCASGGGWLIISTDISKIVSLAESGLWLMEGQRLWGGTCVPHLRVTVNDQLPHV